MSEYETYGDYIEELIPVVDLEVDIRVQRPLDTRKAQRIANNFNPSALGIITVSKRADRSMIVIDGQTRLEAVRRVTDATGKVPCRVFSGLTLQQEAQMFLDLNTTTKPSLLDSFQVRVTAEDPDAMDMNNIVRSYGWDIKGHPRNGYIQAIAAVERVYQKSKQLEADPNLLQMTIAAITRAWGLNQEGVHAIVLQAIGSLFAQYGSDIEFDRLVSILESWEGGPAGLATQGRAHASVMGLLKYHGVAGLIVIKYNKNLSRNKLTEWRFSI